MGENLAVANSMMVWFLCGITVLVSLFQALLYMKMAKKSKL